MNKCEIVVDLLPSYCDGLTSPESTTLVEAHIAECPCCAGTLVAMRNRQNIVEEEGRQEEFRNALHVYELRHKVRVLWIVLACAIVLIGFFVLRNYSAQLALIGKGVSLEHMEIVSATASPQYSEDTGESTSGQLIWSRDKDDKAVLALLRKNFLGFWYVTSLVTADSVNGYNPDCFFWTDAGWNAYGTDSDHYVNAHVVFVGDNAVKYIDFPQEELPENARALVRQKHNHYMIYVTGVLESGKTYVWNIAEILEEHGFIASTAEEE